MLQWFGISGFSDQYIDVVYIIGLVNARHQTLIVARISRSFIKIVQPVSAKHIL